MAIKGIHPSFCEGVNKMTRSHSIDGMSDMEIINFACKHLFLPTIPDSKVIYCDHLNGVSLIARLQIDKYLTKIIHHPERKCLYLLEINKIILFNLGLNIKRKKDGINE
jgi:hypothetical protein